MNAVEHLGGGAAEGAVPGDVARERGRDEGRQLVRQPVDGAHPAHAARLRGGILGVALPRTDRDLADMATQSARAAVPARSSPR